ncbi:MAG: aminotransferase class IV family protein [Nitrospinae bacterium]|nr:aminotransferase class IV family protein [Nitrospinota bacterium]
MKAILNGVVTENPAVSVMDRGFTLGDGLFETIPLYGGKPFLLEKHLERIRQASEVIGLQITFVDAAVAGGIAFLAKEAGVSRGVARLTVTRGEGPRGYGYSGAVNPTWVLTVEMYEPMAESKRQIGFTLAPSSIIKNSRSPLSGVKSTSALERVMMKAEAERAGADEAFTLSDAGHVACGAAVNIFWARQGRLETPSINCGILPGVTRGAIISLARQNGMEVAEGSFEPSSLAEADEVFVTNSLLEIVSVRQITGLGRWDKTHGPVVERLTASYRALIR